MLRVGKKHSNPALSKVPGRKPRDAMIIRCKNEGMTSWSKISKHVRGRGRETVPR